MVRFIFHYTLKEKKNENTKSTARHTFEMVNKKEIILRLQLTENFRLKLLLMLLFLH